MVKTLLKVFEIVLMFSLVSCTSTSDNSDSEDNINYIFEGWNSDTIKLPDKLSFEVSYPKGWGITDYNNIPVLIDSSCKERKSFCSNCVFTSFQKDSLLTLLSVRDSIVKKLNRSYDSVKINRIVDVDIKGKDGVLIDYTMKRVHSKLQGSSLTIDFIKYFVKVDCMCKIDSQISSHKLRGKVFYPVMYSLKKITE